VAVLALMAVAGLLHWRAVRLTARSRAASPSEDAVEIRLRRAVEARPNDEAARRELGQYEEDHARPFQAMWEYAEAQQLKSGDPALPLHLASVLQKGQLMDVATAQLRRALQARPEDLEIRRRLAELYLGTAEPQRARGVMEERGRSPRSSVPWRCSRSRRRHGITSGGSPWSRGALTTRVTRCSTRSW
jgi:hypothetical protein